MLKIVISPAKKMNITDEFPCNATVPVFSDRADVLHGILKNKNIQELKTLWKCSDKLAEQNYQRLHAFSPDQAVTPALLAYEGIQYQHIAPSVFTDAQWHYVNVHLRILSGFYGILKPTDKVIPYRLEMQAKLEAAKKNDLYEYWSDTLYQSLLAEGMTELVNLASAEYSKAILPYKNIRCITCIFGEEVNGKIKVKGTQAKIARGEMVRWMADQKTKAFRTSVNSKNWDIVFLPLIPRRTLTLFLFDLTAACFVYADISLPFGPQTITWAADYNFDYRLQFFRRL